jgi:putative ABC transport system substrate-binding protein
VRFGLRSDVLEESKRDQLRMNRNEFPESADEGGFAAYGPRRPALYEAMARQVVQLFRGIKVADVPVEQASKFELVINLKTAKAMGVAVPEALLVRADKVIE